MWLGGGAEASFRYRNSVKRLPAQRQLETQPQTLAWVSAPCRSPLEAQLGASLWRTPVRRHGRLPQLRNAGLYDHESAISSGLPVVRNEPASLPPDGMSLEGETDV